MKIEIIEHYEKYDKEFSGDYSSIEVKIDNKIVRLYGDYYHDKGQVKAEAFIDGLNYALKLEIIPKITKKASGKTG